MRSVIVLFVTGVLLSFLVSCSSSSKKSTRVTQPPEYTPTKQQTSVPIRRVQWPHTVKGKEAEVTFYEPQISDWKDYQQASAWLAVSAIRTGTKTAVFGAVKLEANTSVDFKSRRVYLINLKVTEIRFQELNKQEQQKLSDYVTTSLLKLDRPVNLDLMLTSLADTNKNITEVVVNTKPPVIHYRAQPTILLQTDGKPLLSPIKGVENIQFVVNTNWDLYLEATTNYYYLLNKDLWLSAKKISGPWLATEMIPAKLGALPNEPSWQETIAHFPPAKWQKQTAPEVIVSSKVAELIVTAGKPELELIDNTGLSYVKNTQSDLFRAENGHWYYLVSGRWFSSKSLTGSWRFATNKLPDGFKQIPLDHDKGHVLSSVPGTIEARLAVLQSQIPVKAAVSRNAAVEVSYGGDPKFERISGTQLKYAVNTHYDVIQYKKDYYVCYNGVWFVGPTPTGQFIVASSIPTEIYKIPSSHPLYHVTFVVIYEFTPTTVTTGYTSGYHHHYVSSSVVVWGSGWYYPPYYYYYDYYPYYYSYPYTYGISAAYNPATGTYARRGVAYGPYGGMGRSAAYNPTTGTYARGRSVWDSNSGYGVGQAYNPRTNTSVITSQGYDDYDRWGETVVQRGDEWASISKRGNEQGTVRTVETSKGGKGAFVNDGDSRAGLAKNEAGDIYAGKDGNVYKKEGDSWYKREDGDWGKVDDEKVQQARDQFSDKSDSIRTQAKEQGINKETIKERAGQEKRFNGQSRKQTSLRPSINRDTATQLNRDLRNRNYSNSRNRSMQNRSFSRGNYNRGGMGRSGGRMRRR